jgi:hypothetical protein
MPTQQLSGLDGTGVLAIWSDAVPAHEEEFNNWYTNQHLPERVGVPGFRRGRRYVQDTPGELRYFTLYECADIGVLKSAPYLERLNNPTDWTRRAMPFFSNGSRAAMVVASSAGAGVGGLAATIQFSPGAGRAEELQSWIVAAGGALRGTHPDLTGWHLCQSDDQVTRAKAGTEEARASRRPAAPAPAAPAPAAPAPAAPPAAPRWMLMAEATGPGALTAAGQLLGGDTGLGGRGATGISAFRIYRLMIALT